MPSPDAPACFALHHGPEPDVLCLRWRRGPTLPELQQAYAHTLDRAVRLQAPRWLVDARQRQHLSPEQVRWLYQEFLPALCARLPEPLRLACLLTPEQVAAARQDPARMAQVQQLLTTEQPFWLAFFDDEAAARRWLLA